MRDLPDFLTGHGVEVTDVTSGVAPGTRRLIVGQPGNPQPSHVVALANTREAVAAIDTEARHLGELRALLPPQMRSTLPEVVERLEVGGQPSLAMTAVPGLCSPTTADGSGWRRYPDPILSWLERLWQDTAGIRASVDLGQDALDVLAARFSGAAAVADTLGAVHRARGRISRFTTPRTMSHGCLCPRHVFVRDGEVTGVDDWGSSQVSGDPLRDLGGWLVRSAGPRLTEVVAARTPYNRALRDFVIAGLAVWGIPMGCWRDVLLLVRAEIAVDALRAGDYSAMDLLTNLSRALPRERRNDGNLK